MLTILGSLIGFLTSALPSIFGYFSKAQDYTHEIMLMKMQIEMQQAKSQSDMEEEALKADTAQYQEIYKTYNVGNSWIDGFNALIRPCMAIAFFSLYVYIKYAYFVTGTGPLWGEEDSAIFASVIAFYFGNRSFDKVRRGR